MDIVTILENTFRKGRVKVKKDISPYLTLRTNTVAEFYVEVETREELVQAVVATKKLHLPLFVLGGGSNLAVTIPKITGLVVRNLYQKKEIVAETPEYVDILFSSGYPISRVVAETTAAGLEGFEHHLGLPGTVGGALFMNSKWTNPVNYCGDNLLYAFLLKSDGKVRQVEREYFQFAYDYSILQKTHGIVLEGVFRLRRNDSQVLKKRAQEALAYRKQTQPFGVATGGCFFQNISSEEKERIGSSTTSAGYLIDQAGLKGMRVGSFVVSDKHANFIINEGKGNPEDLKKLLQLVKERVREKYGVELREEVLVVGDE